MTKLTLHLHDGTTIEVEDGRGMLNAILRERDIKVDDEEIPFRSIVYVEATETEETKPDYEDDFCVPYSEGNGRCAVVGEAIVGTDVVCG